MKKWLRQLQGRLTLSYILVAMVAMLTLTLGTAVLTAITLQPKKFSGGAYVDKGTIQTTSLNIAPYLAPYLEQNPPDVKDLNRRLVSMVQPPPKGMPLLETSEPPIYPDVLVVLNRGNQPLAISGGRGGQIQPILDNATVQSAILAAWTGDQTTESLAAHLPNGRTVIASPLIGYDYHPVGVVVGVYSISNVEQATISNQKNQAEAVSTTLAQLFPGVSLFILGSSMLGVLVGVFFSRGLARRLRNIARAAHDWSKGEFQVMVRDRSQDEIGQLAQDLNEMARQLQQFVTARQELAVIEERHRLARDLHDSIKQQLFVMTMLVGTARAQAGDQPQVVQSLDEAERIATQAHQELTALIRALRPTALVGKSFGLALRDLVTAWARSTGIDAVTNIPDKLVVSSEIEQALFRVTQEALANVARHSDATTVTVEAGTTSGTFYLRIADNGHGFDVDSALGKGLGLASMRERVAALDGMLTLTSSTIGTNIGIELPLIAEQSDRAAAHFVVD
jgi:two-component system, NarL family, sensor histidine kinase LiaS